jgi:serine phosphatase RsbU (regulator of sigma subunit)
MTFRSIKSKILVALLAVALLPLTIFVGISYTDMQKTLEHVKAERKEAAKASLVRTAEDQATIANAILSKAAAEASILAYSAEVLLRNRQYFSQLPKALGATGADALETVSVTLAPDISPAAAVPEQLLFSRLSSLFTLIHKGDPNLDFMYLGTQSGVYLKYPRIDEYRDTLAFPLDATFEPQADFRGGISVALREKFRQEGITLSPNTAISPVQPGKKWVIRDDVSRQIFSLRRNEAGLEVFWEYDPRIRPWYANASNSREVTWTKYPNWSLGERLFSLTREPSYQLADGKVPPALARAFADKQIVLTANSPITVSPKGHWRLQDKNGKNFEIRNENGQLQVYGIDILTGARAVRTPEGDLAGVVGMDIGMNTISKRIINTPGEDSGYAFLLNEQGALIEQEQPDMYVPPLNSEIRRKMISGESGFAFDAENATYIAYAPIRSIHSPDQKSYWSVGISMPEAEVTRLADDVQNRVNVVYKLLAGVLVVLILFLIFVAFRMSGQITGPILMLDQGAKRIGSGELDHRLDVHTGDEIEELADTFNKMADDLKTYIKNLEETTAQKERFASELRVGRDIQMSLLKKIFPAFPHRTEFSLYATLVPAREVGGDLYDFALLDDDRVLFYVGDVSDKGVPASLIMAMTMTLMKRSGHVPGISPAGILRQVNEGLAEDNESAMFVTLFIGILNFKTGELVFSNAGHNPPLILKPDGQCRYLTLPDCLVLGVMTEAEYRDDSVLLERGDMIVTYTDGVTEAMSVRRELYSEERLQETLASASGSSVEEAVEGIISSVRVHATGAPQSDDIAVMAVKLS